MNALSTPDHFEDIIRHQSVVELMPFLLALTTKDIVAVREKSRKLHRELTEHRQLGTITWGRTGTNAQLQMLFLAAIRTYSSKEALAAPFANELSMLNPSWTFYHENGFLPHNQLLELVKQLLARHVPTWLANWLGDNNRNGFSAPIDFGVLLDFERCGFVEPSPRLLALSAISELTTYGTQATMLRQLSAYENSQVALTATQQTGLAGVQQHFAWLAPHGPLPSFEALVYEKISRNAALLERVIPLFFEFDVNQDSASAHSLEHKVWQRITWREIILHFLATNHLDRANILTRCLLALRRDFRRPLLTWFKELFLSLKPTRAERLARQDELTELLAHPLPLVVNFAIEQVKDLLPEPGFALAPLLQYADNLLLRPDLKTGLKTLLAGLAKLPRHDAAHAPAVARLLAAALAHPDATVQERAAKGLADLLAAKKPLLPPADTAETLVALANQAELLGSAARKVLAPWLAAPTPLSATEAAATYVPLAQFVPEISAATAITPVADWHELLFLTGQVLRHDDPAALERWLDGLLRLHGYLPAGYAAQLEPYLVQVLPELKKASLAEKAALLWGHQGLSQALVLSWATDFTTLLVPDVEVTATHYARTPLLPLDKLRYAQVEQLLRRRQSLPLLSTPTHAPHWIAPTALIIRLLAYQQANTEPAVADLLMALTRTAHAHPTEAAAALRLVPQLQRAELRELLTWFLGAALELPAQAAPPGRRPADLTTPLATALPELWAVAARTKAPTHAFPTLPARLGYDYAGIAQPLRPMPEITTGANHFPQYGALGQTTATYRWTEVHWSSAAAGPPPSALLAYAPPAAKNREGSWEHNMLLKNDLQFLHSLLPNYPAPLYEYILRSAAWADNLESSERDLVAQALHTLLGPGPAHDLPASALLASGLVHHAPICRGLGQEALLQAVTNGRLDPALLGQILGQQLATGYAPAQRLADNLAPLRAISPATDDALAQVLDALLPALPPAPLRNLRKLLETYADLVARTRRPVPPAVQDRLREWSQTAALKKLAGSLLK